MPSLAAVVVTWSMSPSARWDSAAHPEARLATTRQHAGATWRFTRTAALAIGKSPRRYRRRSGPDRGNTAAQTNAMRLPSWHRGMLRSLRFKRLSDVCQRKRFMSAEEHTIVTLSLVSWLASCSAPRPILICDLVQTTATKTEKQTVIVTHAATHTSSPGIALGRDSRQALSFAAIACCLTAFAVTLSSVRLF